MDKTIPNLPSKKADKKLHETTSIRATWRLKDFIFRKSTPRESEEETLWRIIGMKEVSKEDIKNFPPGYVDKLNQGKVKK